MPIRDHVLLEVVELRAGERDPARAERRSAFGRIRNTQRAVAFDPVIVAPAAQLEPASRKLQALLVVGAKISAHLQEYILLLGIRNGAGGAQTDSAPIAVISNSAIDKCAREHQVERLLLVSEFRTDLPHLTVTVKLRA